MVFQWRELGQSRPSNTSASSIYSPAGNNIGVVRNINITNPTAGGETFRLFADKAGTTYDKTTALYYDKSIAATETIQIKSFLPFENTDNLAFRVSTATTAVASVYGSEHEVEDVLPNTDKILGQVRPSVGGVAVSLYSPPANTHVVITALFICNTEVLDDTFKLYIDHNGSATTAAEQLYHDQNVVKNQTFFTEPFWAMNDSTGNISVESATGSSLTFTIFGTEMPK